MDSQGDRTGMDRIPSGDAGEALLRLSRGVVELKQKMIEQGHNIDDEYLEVRLPESERDALGDPRFIAGLRVVWFVD